MLHDIKHLVKYYQRNCFFKYLVLLFCHHCKLQHDYLHNLQFNNSLITCTLFYPCNKKERKNYQPHANPEKKILKPKSPFFMICHFYLNFSCSINTDAVKFNYYIYTFDLLKWHIFCCCFILTFFFLDIQKKSNLQERCHDFFMQDKTNDNLIIIFSYILLYQSFINCILQFEYLRKSIYLFKIADFYHIFFFVSLFFFVWFICISYSKLK